MTPEQLALVQRSFAAALEQSDTLSEHFYERLFEAAPELRSLFPDDLGAQRQKLIDELSAIVAAIADLEALVARTAPLGIRHAAYGAQAEHYGMVEEALLDTLAEVLGDRWDAATASAWTRAYDLVAETMLQAGATATRH